MVAYWSLQLVVERECGLPEVGNSQLLVQGRGGHLVLVVINYISSEKHLRLSLCRSFNAPILQTSNLLALNESRRSWELNIEVVLVG